MNNIYYHQALVQVLLESPALGRHHLKVPFPGDMSSVGAAWAGEAADDSPLASAFCSALRDLLASLHWGIRFFRFLFLHQLLLCGFQKFGLRHRFCVYGCPVAMLRVCAPSAKDLVLRNLPHCPLHACQAVHSFTSVMTTLSPEKQPRQRCEPLCHKQVVPGGFMCFQVFIYRDGCHG